MLLLQFTLVMDDVVLFHIAFKNYTLLLYYGTYSFALTICRTSSHHLLVIMCPPVPPFGWKRCKKVLAALHLQSLLLRCCEIWYYFFQFLILQYFLLHSAAFICLMPSSHSPYLRTHLGFTNAFFVGGEFPICAVIPSSASLLQLFVNQECACLYYSKQKVCIKCVSHLTEAFLFWNVLQKAEMARVSCKESCILK